MTTVLHTWVYGRFIEMQSNLRRKKLKAPIFLGASFSHRDYGPKSNFEEKVNLSNLKDDFSSRIDPFIFSKNFYKS